MRSDDTMDGLLAVLQRAERLLIFTGAGISTDSGIPDFRGPQGIWKTRQPVYFFEFLSSEKKRIEHWEY
ncbi:MAG TPA: Sir2 family NAD-dependent protein deacetylase, partial [Terrimicrobiaceae bacterium]|nr:Sir2 family NAD-dependent protein deacetylase [Terrimicrobiaceae bacterium]